MVIGKCMVVLVGLSLASASSAVVAPDKSLYSIKPGRDVELGKKVLRPHLQGDQELGLFKSKGLKVVSQSDERSGVPRVLTGGLMPQLTLKSKDDQQIFIDTAKNYVRQYRDLLGVSVDDLKLNEDAVLMGKEVQFLKFKVYRKGILIQDASLDFRFKHGNLVQVINHTFSEAKLDNRESHEVLADRITEVVDAVDVSLLDHVFRAVETEEGYRLVKVARFQVEGRLGESLSVQVEAGSGKIFEIQDNHYHFNGQVKTEIYSRWYDEVIIEAPLGMVRVAEAGGEVTTNGEGLFSATEGSAPKLKGLRGPMTRINNVTGPELTANGVFDDGLWNITYRGDQRFDPWVDKTMAQMMVFFHTNKIIEHSKQWINPRWFDTPLTANTNLSRSCNAHWDGSTINFYSADSSCANTGILADVIYHEWGHGLDANTGGIDDGAFSEGFGDVVSMMITKSPKLGIGFVLDGRKPVRDLETKKVYPQDARGGVHAEGMIYGTAMWSLFNELMAKYGEDEAQALISKYALKSIYTASRYLDVYEAMLVIDDNDADLLNGTPNLCVINRVFVEHGLAKESDLCRLATMESVVFEETIGNQNGVIEPGETIEVKILAKNHSSIDLSGLGAELSVSDSNVVTVTKPDLVWETIPASGSALSVEAAEMNIASDAACGTAFRGDIRFFSDKGEASSSFQFLVGRLESAAIAYGLSGLPRAIPDASSVAMSLPIEGDVWGGDTTIHEAHLKFKVTHTYIGDVRIKLVSPAGEAIEVFKGKGRAKNEVFDQNISHLIGGRVGLGEWKVIVEDVSRRDTGSIDSFELQLSPAKFVCE